MITYNELTNSGSDLTKFYLSFESRSKKRAAVFEFKIYKIESIYTHQIVLNTYQTGVINSNEIINYSLDLSS